MNNPTYIYTVERFEEVFYNNTINEIGSITITYKNNFINIHYNKIDSLTVLKIIEMMIWQIEYMCECNSIKLNKKAEIGFYVNLRQQFIAEIAEINGKTIKNSINQVKDFMEKLDKSSAQTANVHIYFIDKTGELMDWMSALTFYTPNDMYNLEHQYKINEKFNKI